VLVSDNWVVRNIFESGVGRLDERVKATSRVFSISPELRDTWPTVALLLIFFLALSIRMVPTRYGTILDPDAFYMFRMASNIVEKGYYPVWDNLGWQPWGRSLAADMPLLPFAVAYTFMALKAIGVRMALNTWTILFAGLVGATSVFGTFLIGRAMRDTKTGLLAAFLIATIPEFLNRTIGGVTDKECLAFPLMLTGMAFFAMMIKEKDLDRALLKALCAGFFLGLVALTWGGFTYILLLLSAFYALSVILDIAAIYGLGKAWALGCVVASSSMLFVAMGIRNWSVNNPFVLIHILSIAALVVYYLLVKVSVPMGYLSRRSAIALFVGVSILVGLFPIYGASLGLVRFRIPYKFIILLNPFATPKEGMHVTVQEYANPTFGDFISRYNIYLFISIAGMIIAVLRRFSSRLVGMFVVLWALSGFYAGLSAIRNTMLLTPALCLLTALAIVEFTTVISRERAVRFIRGLKSKGAEGLIRRELRLARLGGPIVALLLIILLMPSMMLGIDLVKGRGPILGKGWYDALTWLGKETPEDSILLSWWDYGHWITAVAKRRCVSDGATTNFTTIQRTAIAYMSPEDVAKRIFKSFHVEYVIVPEHDFWLAGAFSTIVGNITDFPEGYYKYNPKSGGVSWNDLTPKGRNTTIYKLLFDQPDPEANNFELIHVSPGTGSFTDTTVRIYKFNPS